MRRIRKAVFPVGGLGTRFLPVTKAMPKEMLPVVDKPLIQYAFEEAQAAGIEQFIFITGRNKNIIGNHFDHAYELQKILDQKEKKDLLAKAKDWLPEAGRIAFIRQQEALGLGHAVLCAKDFIGDEPFAVLLADEMFICKKPLLKQMVETYNKRGGNIIAVNEIDRQDTDKYGIVDIAEKASLRIKNMVEKPKQSKAPSNMAIIGRYILQPEIFTYLEKTSKGAGNEIQLTDAMVKLLKKQEFYGHHLNGRRYDCGSVEGFLEANIAFALERSDLKTKVRKMLKELI